MAENLIIPTHASKVEKYEALVPQIKSLISGEKDVIANLSNIMSALKYGMGYFWVGCYFVRNDELVLGPFQGTIACTRIKKGKGVCGKAWELNEVIIVDDVDKFPGHIACSSESKSEIVLPVCDANGNVLMILDVDSDQYSDFDEIDRKYLLQIIDIIQSFISGKI